MTARVALDHDGVARASRLVSMSIDSRNTSLTVCRRHGSTRPLRQTTGRRPANHDNWPVDAILPTRERIRYQRTSERRFMM